MSDLNWEQVAELELAREEAREILSACACSETRDGLLGDAMGLGIDPDDTSAQLALVAWKTIAAGRNFSADPRGRDWTVYEEVAAEAESLLASGWLPGMKVKL